MNRKIVTIGGFLSFFLFGFVDNMKGPTIPAVIADLNLRYVAGGTLPLMAYFGFVSATLATGPLSDLAGKKSVLIGAGVCLLLGVSGYGFLGSFLLLALSMFVLGLGLGAIEVGGNGLIVDLYQAKRGKYLNLLAFFHGLGSMTAPLYAGKLLASDISWRWVYRGSLFLIVLLPLFFLFIRYPHKRTESGGLDLRGVGKAAFTRVMVLYYVLIAVYVGAEIGIGTWMVEFLKVEKSYSIFLASAFLSLFFGLMTVGRLLGSFVVDRIGYLKSMLIATAAALVAIILGTFGPPALGFFIPIVGLFFSIMFPNVTAAVSDMHVANRGTILGILFTSAGIGGMAVPWLVGLWSDIGGLLFGFSGIAFFCLVMLVLVAILTRMHGEGNQVATTGVA